MRRREPQQHSGYAYAFISELKTIYLYLYRKVTLRIYERLSIFATKRILVLKKKSKFC